MTPDIRDAERLQGFPADWTKPAEDVGKPSLRWSLIGNAVSTPVAEWLGSRLLCPGVYDRLRDLPLDVGGRWPRAARFDGHDRRGVRIGALPVWHDREPLADFLHYGGKSLSARATRGFLSRTERGTLRFVPGFKEALRQHLDVMDRAAFECSMEAMPIAAE